MDLPDSKRLVRRIVDAPAAKKCFPKRVPARAQLDLSW
jgi:hypothetical protein